MPPPESFLYRLLSHARSLGWNFRSTNGEAPHRTEVAASNFRLNYGRPEGVRGRTSLVTMIDEIAHFPLLQTASPDPRPAVSRGAAVPPRPPAAQEIREEIDRDILSALTREAERDPAMILADSTPTYFEPSYVTAPVDRRALRAVREDLMRAGLMEAMLRPGEMLIMSNPEFVGQVPTVRELPVEPASFTATERIGMAVVNPRGVSRVQIPTFEITSNPTIHLEDIRQRRFDLIERGVPVAEVSVGFEDASRTASLLWAAFLQQKLEPSPEQPLGYFEG